VWKALPEQARSQAATGELTGRVVVGGRATSDGMEVLGRSFGVSAGSPASSVVGAAEGTGMVADLPADTVAAVGLTGLGEGMAGLYDELVAGEDPFGVAEVAAATGVQLPDDLRVLFGEETVAAAFGEADVAARSRTDDPDRALAVVEALMATLLGLGGAFDAEVYEEDVYIEVPPDAGLYGDDVPLPAPPSDEFLPPDDTTFGAVGRELSELPADQLRRLEDGIAVGTSALAVDRIASGDGGLGRSPVFQRAVPDSDGAGMVLFVDIAKAVELGGGSEAVGDAEGNLDVLEAVGVTAAGGPDGTFRMRLTVR
jgi:hypothetical protein